MLKSVANKICKICGLEKDVADFKPTYNSCKVCFNKNKRAEWARR